LPQFALFNNKIPVTIYVIKSFNAMEINKIPEPTEDTVNQIADYHDEIRQIELEGYELTVKKARNALFWAAGLVSLGEIIGYARSGIEPDLLGIIIVAVIVAAFIMLALWTKKRPYTAIIMGIVVFCLYILLNVIAFAYIEGATGILKGIFGGIIVKILILVALIRPLKDAKELQNAKVKV
jgi:hypothetical protein